MVAADAEVEAPAPTVALAPLVASDSIGNQLLLGVLVVVTSAAVARTPPTPATGGAG